MSSAAHCPRKGPGPKRDSLKPCFVVADPILFSVQGSRVRLGLAAVDGDRSLRIERDQCGDDVLAATVLAGQEGAHPAQGPAPPHEVEVGDEPYGTGEGEDAGL